MRKAKYFAISVLTGLFCISANAKSENRDGVCDPVTYKILKRDLKLTKLRVAQEDSNLVSSVCRKWPYKESSSLIAFAYDEGVDEEKKLVVAVIDNKKMRVLNSVQRSISEDAVTKVGEGSLRLDTARYQLAKDIWAFGVVFDSAVPGASCGNTYSGEQLTLYVAKAARLEPVLTIDRWTQEWLVGCPSSSPSLIGSSELAELTLSMANFSTNGLRDILLTAKITVDLGEKIPDEFKNRRNRIERSTLRFDGRVYRDSRDKWWLRNW